MKTKAGSMDYLYLKFTLSMNFDLLQKAYAPNPPLVRAGYNVKSI